MDERDNDALSDHRGAGTSISSRRHAWGVGFGLLVLSACSSTKFVSTWKAPGARPFDPVGAKVATIVMIKGEAQRRASEDRLANELSKRGAAAVPMYSLMPTPDDSFDESLARAALEKNDVTGVVVLRPVSVEKELVADPVAYGDTVYGGFWGGYYGYGWNHPYGGDVAVANVHTHVTVSVETLLYSLRSNGLVWAGRSETANPENVDELIDDVMEAAGKELEREGLIAH
jgi:hypothetical protein